MNFDGGVGIDVGFYMYDYIRNNVGDADAKDFALSSFYNHLSLKNKQTDKYLQNE